MTILNVSEKSCTVSGLTRKTDFSEIKSVLLLFKYNIYKIYIDKKQWKCYYISNNKTNVFQILKVYFSVFEIIKTFSIYFYFLSFF